MLERFRRLLSDAKNKYANTQGFPDESQTLLATEVFNAVK